MFQWLKNLFANRDRDTGIKSQIIKHNSDETYDNNRDLIEGYVFNATLQIRTPLAILNRHGEFFNGPPSQAPNYASQADGIWIFRLRHMDVSDEFHHASDIGTTSPSYYLPFLKAFRQIVESDENHETKLNQLEELSVSSKDNRDIWAKLQRNYSDFPDSFFYRQLEVIPGIGAKTAKAFYEAGFKSVSGLEKAPDAQLLELPGVGKALVVKIRDYCAAQHSL